MKLTHVVLLVGWSTIGVFARRRGEGVFELMRARTTLPQLQDAAEDITRYVSAVVKLFERIYLEKKLEQ